MERRNKITAVRALSGNGAELIGSFDDHARQTNQALYEREPVSADGKSSHEDFFRILKQLADVSSCQGEIFKKAALRKAVADVILTYSSVIKNIWQVTDRMYNTRGIFSELNASKLEDNTVGPKKTIKKKRPASIYSSFKTTRIPEPQIQRNHVPDGFASLKVVAWNINGLRALLKKRPDALPDLVKRERPDIIGICEHRMQEGGADTENTMNKLLQYMPGYEIAALHCSTAKKGYSGTLMLRRKDGPKLFSVTSLDLPSAKEEGRLIIGELESLFVVVAYVPNSGAGLKRLEQRIGAWDVELRSKLVELSSKKPTLLIGDLNVAHRDRDIWNVEASHVAKSAGTTPQERNSFSMLLDAGFVDGFARSHPEVLGAFTYWSVRARNRPKNRGLRLDYAVVSRSLLLSSLSSGHVDATNKTNPAPQQSRPFLVDVFHLPDMSEGDHCPVGAVFAIV